MSVRRASGFRTLIIAALCGGLLLASGCSALRLAYASAPRLGYWWLDRYVGFDEAQTPHVRDAIDRWFAWNRRIEVPAYVGLLARARAEAAADTDAARVCAWQGELVRRLRVAYDAAVPAAAALLPTLSADQIDHIERRDAHANREFAEKYLQSDPRERAAAALDRTVDRFETIYGRLDEAQRTRISKALARSPFDPERWLDERRRRQQDALELLRAVARGELRGAAIETALRGYADRIERSPRPSYQRYAQRLDAFNCAFVADFHNATSAAQRRHAAETLGEWETDLRAVAADSAPVSLPADPSR